MNLFKYSWKTSQANCWRKFIDNFKGNSLKVTFLTVVDSIEMYIQFQLLLILMVKRSYLICRFQDIYGLRCI